MKRVTNTTKQSKKSKKLKKSNKTQQTMQQDRTTPEYVLYWPYIMAMVPFYDEQNYDCTMVYYVNGIERSYPCSCEQVLEDLARVFRTSLDVLRARTEVVADKGRWRKMRKFPIAFIVDFVMVPVKCRRECQRNTGTLGYVVYHYVERIERTASGQCRICFKDAQLQLDIKQQYRGVQYQMELAEHMNQLTRVEAEYWQFEICAAKKAMHAIILKNKKSDK